MMGPPGGLEALSDCLEHLQQEMFLPFLHIYLYGKYSINLFIIYFWEHASIVQNRKQYRLYLKKSYHL